MLGTSSSHMSPRQDSCLTLSSAKSALSGYHSSQPTLQCRHFANSVENYSD